MYREWLSEEWVFWSVPLIFSGIVAPFAAWAYGKMRRG
jgi:hypothetical protein